jgi:hypothetical protein
MPRYYYSGARDTTEQAKRIELSWLRKHNYLGGFGRGNLSWSRNGNQTGNINIYVDTYSENPNIKLTYKARKHGEEEWIDIDFSFRMESIPCRFGGKKWFFICGLYKNNQFCGRRARILYMAGNYFGCRKCANLSYESCNVSGAEKQFGKIISIPEIEEMREQVKRTHYRGKPTKKYLRYLKMDERAEMSFIGMATLLSKRVDKIKGAKRHQK